MSHQEGRNRRVSINRDHPLHQPLRQLLLATFGAPGVIANTFAEIDGADQVVLFGSWVARYEGHDGPPPHDVDVLVIGDNVDRAAVDTAADRAEQQLGLPVQATIRTPDAWHDATDRFLATVRSRPCMTVLADDREHPQP